MKKIFSKGRFIVFAFVLASLSFGILICSSFLYGDARSITTDPDNPLVKGGKIFYMTEVKKQEFLERQKILLIIFAFSAITAMLTLFSCPAAKKKSVLPGLSSSQQETAVPEKGGEIKPSGFDDKNQPGPGLSS